MNYAKNVSWISAKKNLLLEFRAIDFIHLISTKIQGRESWKGKNLGEKRKENGNILTNIFGTCRKRYICWLMWYRQCTTKCNDVLITFLSVRGSNWEIIVIVANFDTILYQSRIVSTIVGLKLGLDTLLWISKKLLFKVLPWIWDCN
jgi:hypothetical protein